MSEDLSKLNLVELIDLLEPAPEPMPISLWPQTVGWLLLALILSLAVAYVAWRWHRHWQANAYRREALDALALSGGNPRQVAEVLRRAALSVYPREQVAGLYGEEWLQFLDRTGRTTEFSEGAGRALAKVPYEDGIQMSGAADLARVWIKTHVVDAG